MTGAVCVGNGAVFAPRIKEPCHQGEDCHQRAEEDEGEADRGAKE